MSVLEQINHFIPTIAFVTAGIGAVIAYWRFAEEGRRQRQQMADGLYQRYLERAMDAPELSWPENGTIPDDPRYPWFVAIMCNALAAQLECDPPADMREALKEDLRVHQTYFEDDKFKKEDGSWNLYPCKLRQLYAEMITENYGSVAKKNLPRKICSSRN